MLANDLLQVFDTMLADSLSAETDISEQLLNDLAEGFSESLATSIEAALTSCLYSGVCSFGTVTQTVSTLDSIISASPSKAPFVAQVIAISQGMISGDNSEFTDALADAINTFTISLIITETVTGTAIPIPTPPPTVPVAGSASASLIPTALPLLKTQLLAAALSPSAGDNTVFANQSATAIIAFWSTCTVSALGTDAVTGLTGTGSLTGTV